MIFKYWRKVHDMVENLTVFEWSILFMRMLYQLLLLLAIHVTAHPLLKIGGYILKALCFTQFPFQNILNLSAARGPNQHCTCSNAKIVTHFYLCWSLWHHKHTSLVQKKHQIRSWGLFYCITKQTNSLIMWNNYRNR